MTGFDPTVGVSANAGGPANTVMQQAEKDRAVAYAQVRAINASIAECKGRRDVQCLEALAPLLKSWLGKLDDANRRLGNGELSTTEKTVAALYDYIQDVKKVGGELAGDVGKGVLKAALPFLAVGFALLFLKNKLL